MFRYSAFGLALESEIAIPELAPTDREPDVKIRLSPLPRSMMKATLDEEFVYTEDGGLFHIRNGREILVNVRPGDDTGALRVFLLGRVMAFLLRQRGWLPLHASGVALGGRGILFAGPSGAGKSTTAAAFHAQGHRVITDDVGAVCARAGTCLIQPGGARIRLFDDSCRVLDGLRLHPQFQTDKHTYTIESSDTGEALPLRRIYILETGSGFASERLGPVLAAALLNRHSFVKQRRSEREVLEAHLRQCAVIAGMVPVYLLIRPLSLALLPELVRMVEADLSPVDAG